MSDQILSHPQPEIRDVLFGDLPISAWPPEDQEPPTEEPWLSFVQARNHLNAGETTQAAQILQTITAMPGLEARHILQAWHFLRQLGIPPLEDEAKRVYGVVVEVALENGLDLVVAYSDGTARYYNYSGAGIVWERPDTSLDPTIIALLNAGQTVVNIIGPWEGPRPPAPPTGEARINMLTPSGLHFGQAPLALLSQDSLGGPVIQYAMQLMQELIAKTEM